MQRRQWRAKLTPGELGRGWAFFALFVLVFPVVMGLVQRSFHGELPVAESNLVYYLLSVTLVLLVLWNFLRQGLDLLLDWLPENLFALITGLLGFVALSLLIRLIPIPVANPAVLDYPLQYAMSPQATVVLLVVLMPIVEEILFRGLLFGTLRPHSKLLAYLLSVLLFAFYCVWQFIFTYQGPDLRYLLLFIQYLPMSAALTWCYDAGGSIWSPVALHMIINGLHLSHLVG